jgi:hypothetical protein
MAAQQTLPLAEYGEQEEGDLTDAQRELVEKMQQVAAEHVADGKPFSGLAEFRIADYFRELFRLRNQREVAMMHGDHDRAAELTSREDDLLRDLKRVGAPYHPAFGTHDDWERLDASEPGKRDYNWQQGGTED